MNSIVITGASTGIGHALSKVFLNAGYRVFGSVRKQTDADKLSEQFGENFTPLIFDVTNRPAIDLAVNKVSDFLDGQPLAGLINNAGIAVAGPLMMTPVAEYRNQFEVNVFGLISVTQAFLPLLGATEKPVARPGRIMNVSSVSGKIAAPFMSPYCGSKFAVEGVSTSLRRELQSTGIKVITIAPGAVKTPIWDKASATEIGDEFKDSIFGKNIFNFQKMMLSSAKRGLDPQMLAENMLGVFEKQNPKVRYTFVAGRFANWIMPYYMLPARTLDKMIFKMLRR